MKKGRDKFVYFFNYMFGAAILLSSHTVFAQTVTGRGFASGAESNFQALRQEILHLTNQVNTSQAEIAQLRAELGRSVPT